MDWTKDVAEFVVYCGAFGGYPSLGYVYTYWTSHLIGSLFLLFVTCELSFTRLFPQFYKVSFYRHLFSLAAVMIAELGLFAAYGEHQLAVVPKVMHIADVLHVLALLFFVGLMQFMGWRFTNLRSPRDWASTRSRLWPGCHFPEIWAWIAGGKLALHGRLPDLHCVVDHFLAPSRCGDCAGRSG